MKGVLCILDKQSLLEGRYWGIENKLQAFPGWEGALVSFQVRLAVASNTDRKSYWSDEGHLSGLRDTDHRTGGKSYPWYLSDHHQNKPAIWILDFSFHRGLRVLSQYVVKLEFSLSFVI